MKILAFVDLHGSTKALEKIEKQSELADVIVCAGDLTIFENNLSRLLARLNKLKKPIVIVHGNHENKEDIHKFANIFENIKEIHEKSLIIGDCLFLGYGGGGFSIVDKHFERISKFFEKKMKKSNLKTILVTHAPPYETKVDSIMGNPCGNKSIKNFIKKMQPTLAISGHLHETAGKEDHVGKTKVINPGPYGKIIEVSFK